MLLPMLEVERKVGLTEAMPDNQEHKATKGGGSYGSRIPYKLTGGGGTTACRIDPGDGGLKIYTEMA